MQQPPRQRILGADDQLDLLKPHIIFLQEKGYIVTGVPNGDDALALLEQEQYDLVLLDEMMPGKNGLETLQELRRFRTDIPVIMITKSEEEHLMNEALGRQITDYLQTVTSKTIDPTMVQARQDGKTEEWVDAFERCGHSQGRRWRHAPFDIFQRPQQQLDAKRGAEQQTGPHCPTGG